jgi:2-dehydro-3-deoxyphosphogluconate aldolase / (4S)-4-hydroxy-2-oxoglutarate aldolase
MYNAQFITHRRGIRMSHFSENKGNRFKAIEVLLQISPIIPSVEILDEFDAIPLCDALLAGGAKITEVNIRTDAAYEAIHIIRNRCPQIIIGAGNIKTPDMLKRAIDSGAEFATSPGNTVKLLEAVETADFPFLPGVSVGSDMMCALEYGHNRHKFCPTVAFGGVKALKYFQGQFFDVKFCVSGGISDDNVCEFLNLPNVECALGTWIVRAHDIYSKRWTKITERTLLSYQNVVNYAKDTDSDIDLSKMA